MIFKYKMYIPPHKSAAGTGGLGAELGILTQILDSLDGFKDVALWY